MGFELGRTGIHHFISTADVELLARLSDLGLFDPQEPGDLGIGVAGLLQFEEEFRGDVIRHIIAHQLLLELDQLLNLADEPRVDAG